MPGNCLDGLGCVGEKEGANKAYRVKAETDVEVRSCKPNPSRHNAPELQPKPHPSSHRLFQGRQPWSLLGRTWALSNRLDH